MRTTNKMKAIVVTLVTAILCTCLFTACKNVNVDDPIAINELNSTSTKVAEGYIQSIFTGDEEMFYQCFPEVSILKDNKAFDEYDMSGDPDHKYIGVKYVNYNELNSENGYDEDYMRQSISMILSVEENDIQEMQIVKLDVCFEGDSKKDYNSVSVYVVVFQLTDSNWYAFEIQNDGAEFAA